MSIQDWSTTASSNSNSDATINWAENQSAASVNNSSRAMMAIVAGWRDAMGGAKVSAGSANAYTLTTGLSLSSYSNGLLLAFEANHTNTGAATIAIDGLAAKAIITPAGSALNANQIVAAGIYLIVYETGADSVLLLTPSSALGNVSEDTTPSLGGDLDGDGNDLDDMGVLFMREQAEADADVTAQGQWWVNTATPNEPFFTDDAGTDH